MAIWKLNEYSLVGIKICSGDYLSLVVNAPKSDLQLRAIRIESEFKLKLSVQQEWETDNSRYALYNLILDCKRMPNGFKITDKTENTDTSISRACIFFSFKWNACKLDWTQRLPMSISTMRNDREDIFRSKIIISLQKETTDLGIIDLMSREFDFEYRRLCVNEKMRKFLFFQSQLIYGTPDTKDKYDLIEQRYLLSNKNWHLKKMKSNKIAVSTEERNEYASVCITFATQFLAYWHNYGRFYTRLTGSDRERLSNSVKSFGAVKSNGFGDFLTLLPNVVNTYKKLWPIITHSSILPGDVFVSATGHHIVLLVKIGDGFTFKNKEIFGRLVNSPEADCVPGVYIIQANGKLNLEISYKGYGRDESLVKLGQFKIKYPSYITSFENAINALNADMTSEGVFMFNGSDLQKRNGLIKEDNPGKLRFHFCGDALPSDPSNYTIQDVDNTERKIWFVGKIKVDINNTPYQVKSVSVMQRNINTADGLLSNECHDIVPKAMFLTDSSGMGRAKISSHLDLFAHDCRLYECAGDWDNGLATVPPAASTH
jgi:hypothetical protein